MTPEKVEALIQKHIQRYAQIDIPDIYKLLHQALFGPGHPITNRKAAQEWLEKQKELLQPVSDSILLESIHPDDTVVRLHLRPYLSLNGNLKKLMDAAIASSKVIIGDTATMAAWWEIFQHMTDKGGLMAGRFDARTVALLGRTRASEHWPAEHHSPTFELAYKPVYRILTSTIAEKMLKDQHLNFSLV